MKDEARVWEREQTIKCIVCPYYKKMRKNAIICEGAYDRVNLQTNFISAREKQEYIDQFCATECWPGCAVAQLAAEKYE